MRYDALNIMIGGEAGQGLNTISDILCKALVRQGYHLVVAQDYMSRVRGGHNTFSVRAGVDHVLAPAEAIDLLIALNRETVDLHLTELAEDGVILADDKIPIDNQSRISVPLGELADERSGNVASLGVISVLLGLDPEIITKILKQAFGKKGEEVARKNACF